VIELGKFLLLLGAAVIVLGGVLLLIGSGRVPWLGRLPGDIHIQRDRWSLYAPLGTSLLLSIVASALFWLFSRR
jgi:hypothetical protein